MSFTPAAPLGMAHPDLQVLSVACSLAASATTTLYTVPAGKSFMPLAVVLRSFSGDVHTTTVNLVPTGSTTTKFAPTDVTLVNVTTSSLGNSPNLSMTFSPAGLAQTAGAATNLVTFSSWSVLGGADTLTLVVESNGQTVTCVADILGYLF